jgi:hypothetical protein
MPTPASALEQLRRAIVSHDRVLAQSVTDERLAAHIAYFHRSELAVELAGHSHGGVVESLSPRFFSVTFEAMERQPYDALSRFRQAREWLGAGRCSQERVVPLPEGFAALKPVDNDWSESLKRRHREVSEALTRAFAMRFSCAPGVPVVVVFVPATDGAHAPKILAIERGTS